MSPQLFDNKHPHCTQCGYPFNKTTCVKSSRDGWCKNCYTAYTEQQHSNNQILNKKKRGRPQEEDYDQLSPSYFERKITRPLKKRLIDFAEIQKRNLEEHSDSSYYIPISVYKDGKPIITKGEIEPKIKKIPKGIWFFFVFYLKTRFYLN